MLQLSRWGGTSPVGKAKGVLPSAGFAFAPRLGLVCNHQCHAKAPWGARALWQQERGGQAGLAPVPGASCV